MNLIVLHNLLEKRDALEELRGQVCSLLSFADTATEREFIAKCRAGGLVIHSVVRAADRMDETSRMVRELYTRFVSGWSRRPLKGTADFRRLFTYRGELAVWWLSSASMKPNEVRTTFEYLCHLEIIRQALREKAYSRCLLFSDDALMGNIAARCCERAGVPLVLAGRQRRLPKRSLAYYAAARLAFILQLFIKLLYFRIFRPAPPGPGTKPRVGFLAIHPDPMEIGEGAAYDRNYQPLLNALRSLGTVDPLILCWQGGRKLSDWRLLWKKRRAMGSLKGVVFLDGYLRLSDVWLAILSFGTFLRFVWLDRFDPAYRSSFNFEDIDVYDVIGLEFRHCFLSSEIPYHLVVARAVERAVADLGIDVLLSWLEFYPFARAAYYGAIKGNPRIVTVAYQHANITRLKLWYAYQPGELMVRNGGPPPAFIDAMPTPDWFLCQGTVGRDIVVGSGYPAERCLLTGGRYDSLAERVGDIAVAGGGGAAAEGSKKIVAVFPALSAEDARGLIDAVIQACRHRTDLAVLVKSHPSLPVHAFVESAKRSRGFENAKVVEGGVHEWISVADVVVVSYSTVGDEAIALRRPVVCYAGLRPTMSSYLDIPAAPVTRDPESLREAIEKMIEDTDFRRAFLAKREDLVRGSFYRLDGRSAERAASALAQIAAGGSPSWSQEGTASRGL